MSSRAKKEEVHIPHTLGTCPKCGGEVLVIDGDGLRKQREARGISLRRVACRLGISGAYLSDLERGNRQWSGKLTKRFLFAISEGE